jgi:hypothetical protein
MRRIENVTAHPDEIERPLRDDELEAVNGGTIRASSGPARSGPVLENAVDVFQRGGW